MNNSFSMKSEKDSKLRKEFVIAVVISVLWVLGSYFLAYYWFLDLSYTLNSILAFIIISGIAIVPGFLNTFLIATLVMDKTRTEEEVENILETVNAVDITVLVPAYNEQEIIENTLSSIAAVKYKGNVRVIVIDNNSKDDTSLKCREFINKTKCSNISFELMHETEAGKNFALNSALKKVTTDYVLTIDADTILHPDALSYIVGKVQSEENVVAVAGCILVTNPADNLMTQIQDWDYYISINAIKRCQGKYKSTLVTQGAFSIYDTQEVVKLGGWKDTIGEDIVLSWELLEQNKKILFEPLAISYTEVPTSLKIFLIQRARWARGMIEAIRRIRPWKQGNTYSKFVSGIDLWIPYIDFSYTFFWLPGLILAIVFHIYIIVGIYTILVFPLSILTFAILHSRVKRYYRYLDVESRNNAIGIVVFILCYQMLMSPVSLWGYFQEVFGMRRIWK